YILLSPRVNNNNNNGDGFCMGRRGGARGPGMLLWKHIKRLVVGGVQHSINHPRRDDQVQVQSAMAVRLACDYTTTSTITAVSMIVKDPLVAGTLCTCSIRKMVSLLLGGVWGCAVANTSCEGGPTYTSPNIRLHVTLLYR